MLISALAIDWLLPDMPVIALIVTLPQTVVPPLKGQLKLVFDPVGKFHAAFGKGADIVKINGDLFHRISLASIVLV
jgi:hypothetical protein